MFKMKKILVCISGWGSKGEIFKPLYSGFPFAEYKRIELPWQNFVPITQSKPRRKMLVQSYKQECQAMLSIESETTEVILLGWSLGSLLALELSLELYSLQAMSQLPIKMPVNLQLVLISPTAAMCGKDDRAAVPPVALKVMQHKLSLPANHVLHDFTAKLQVGTELSKIYLQQAKTFTVEELKAGLAYLIHCDLRKELQEQEDFPYPVLLFSGQNDAIIPPQQSKALAQLLGTQAEIELVAGGHNPLLPLLSCPSRIIQFIQKEI